MQSVIHSNSNAEGQTISALPWLLTQQQSKDVKVVIEKKYTLHINRHLPHVFVDIIYNLFDIVVKVV